jgi:hypothetical protein
MGKPAAKIISSKEIVWNIYRDTGAQESISHSDIFEWVIEALSLIGNPQGLSKKVTGHKDNPNLEIINYRARLPKDFFKLRQIAVNGFPAYPSSNTFHYLMDGKCCGIDELGSVLSTGEFRDNFGNIFCTNLGTKYGSTPLTYDLNNDFITLSVKEGKVCLSYLAHAVDCDGFPMVPDDISYKKAVEWYARKQIEYIRWRNNPDSSGYRALYEHAEGEYNWYISQAINSAKMPDHNEMEVIKNSLLKLKPEVNFWQTFYDPLVLPELRQIK